MTALSTKTICNIENLTMNVSIETLDRIALAFNCRTEDLLKCPDIKNLNAKDKKKLLLKIIMKEKDTEKIADQYFETFEEFFNKSMRNNNEKSSDLFSDFIIADNNILYR